MPFKTKRIPKRLIIREEYEKGSGAYSGFFWFTLACLVLVASMVISAHVSAITVTVF